MAFEDIASEFRGALLGDRRRSKRLERIASELARNPGLSFPEAMGTEGQLEGLYRFLGNDEVKYEAVHAPHAAQTRSRCHAQDQVLVLHDTTVLRFNGDREGLGRIHEAGGAQGFRLHASLAVTPERAPRLPIRIGAHAASVLIGASRRRTRPRLAWPTTATSSESMRS